MGNEEESEKEREIKRNRRNCEEKRSQKGS
jgi:hypothetical protein